MALKDYNEKREFQKTPEPSGRLRPAKKRKLIFVVQRHAARRLHYDLRLEFEGVLKSWAVPKGLPEDPSEKRLAVWTEDHPVSYASFHGIIPKGNYGAGMVEIYDWGTYHAEGESDPKRSFQLLKKGFEKGHLSFELDGKKIKGDYSLFRTGVGKNWLLIKREKRTEPRVTAFGLKPGVRRKALRKDPWPKKIAPMLSTPVDGPFDKKGWIFEKKYDGYRAIAEIRNGRADLFSRHGISFNEKFPAIVEALSRFSSNAILDGEIVAMKGKGRISFQNLQNVEAHWIKLRYYVFDILYLDGTDLRKFPLSARKELLKEFFKKKAREHVRTAEYFSEKGHSFFKKESKAGGEGIMAKKLDSVYQLGTRSLDWLKIKTSRRQEAVIGGFTAPRRSRKKFGALILGVYENEDLRYIGHTGTGFSDKSLSDVYEKLKPLEKPRSPFREEVKPNMPATWVRPELVAEIKFSEWTGEGFMRHPVFLGLREDKEAREVVLEKEGSVKDLVGEHSGKDRSKELLKKHGSEVEFSNLDKIFWPEKGYTKKDLVDYYAKISGTILPYLKDRPESMLRHPNGIDGESFFQKNLQSKHLPSFIRSEKIKIEKGKTTNFLICNSRSALLYMAQLGCIELNPWSSRIGSLDKPDFMVFDIDPGDNTFDKVIKVARVVKEVLEMSCGISYPKTSGKSGLHVYVPLGAKHGYGLVFNFSKLLSRLINLRLPDITTLEALPAKREGKIYIDFHRNLFGQTTAAPYCLRPTRDATVSTPLFWSEVKKGLDPKKFDIKTIFGRLDRIGDPWRGFLKRSVDLKKALRCLEGETKKFKKNS